MKRMYEAKQESRYQIVLWGSGNPSREFLYVEDAAKGIVLATEKYDKPDPVNLGSGQEITIRELATTIAKFIGYSGEIVWDITKPDGQPRRCLDISKAKKEFQFEAKTSFSEGLKRTIEWYM